MSSIGKDVALGIATALYPFDNKARQSVMPSVMKIRSFDLTRFRTGRLYNLIGEQQIRLNLGMW